jgi:hypothetical protein
VYARYYNYSFKGCCLSRSQVYAYPQKGVEPRRIAKPMEAMEHPLVVKKR